MMPNTIIFIHGLWMNGMDMSLLEHRFKQSSYTTSRFRYKSINKEPIENATKLAEHIETVKSEQIHFVCHSLGGLILRHCLDLYNLKNPGRIVMLGTPNQTGEAARKFLT